VNPSNKPIKERVGTTIYNKVVAAFPSYTFTNNIALPRNQRLECDTRAQRPDIFFEQVFTIDKKGGGVLVFGIMIEVE